MQKGGECLALYVIQNLLGGGAHEALLIAGLCLMTDGCGQSQVGSCPYLPVEQLVSGLLKAKQRFNLSPYSTVHAASSSKATSDSKRCEIINR